MLSTKPLDARVVQAVGGDDVEVAVAAVAVREAQRQVAGVIRAGRRRRRSSRRARAGRPGGRGRAGGCRRSSSGVVAEHAADRLGLPAHALVGADDRDDVGRVLDDRVQAALDDLRGAQRDEQGLAEDRGERRRPAARARSASSCSSPRPACAPSSAAIHSAQRAKARSGPP